MKYKFVVKCKECGEDAFEYSHKPNPGDIVKCKYALVNGKHPEPKAEVKCQNCGVAQINLKSSDIIPKTPRRSRRKKEDEAVQE